MMKDSCDFSIVIVCYNPDLEKLKKTIISCYKQKDVKFEIIISDDGSKFDYEQILNQWARENKIDLIYNFLPENQGTIKNIISAVQISKGKVIKIISPGDYFAEEFVLKKYLAKYEKEDLDMLFSNGYFYQENQIFDKKMPFFKSTIKNNMKKNICMFSDTFLGPSQSFKRELVKYLIEVQDYVRLTEDLVLEYLSVLNNNKIGFINENLFWYEWGTGITSSSHGLDRDIEGLIDYLKKTYSNKKIVRNTIKRYNICMKKNKVLKLLLLTLNYPKMTMMGVYKKLKKIKSKQFDIKKQEMMTII